MGDDVVNKMSDSTQMLCFQTESSEGGYFLWSGGFINIAGLELM